VRRAIERGDEDFIEVASAADLTKKEEKELCNYAADRSGTSRQAVAAMLKDARDNGRLRPAEPTYSAEGTYSSAEEARNRTRQIIQDFLEKNVACPKAKSDPFLEYAISIFRELPIAKAMRVATGIGKTQIAVQEIARWIHEVKVGPIIYAVPRHKLGHEIEAQFAAYGVNARVFRGRRATDPENAERQMCLNPTAVELAMKCHADIPTTCCKSKKVKCRFFDECGYQRQMPNEPVDVWIVAADMLFHTQDVFGEPAAVIIDEAIWRKGIRGIEGQEWVVAIDSLLGPEPELYDDIGMRNSDRNTLGKALQKQENGGVKRQPLAEIFLTGEPPDARVVSTIIRREWKCCPRIDLQPGMSDAEIKGLAKESDLIDDIQHSRRIIKIWEAVREMVRDPDIEVSGRLTIRQRNGQRVVEWRGVEQISKQFQVPTLLLDATLPEASILQVYHPEVEVVADIQVEMPPHVHIRQVLRAPTSSSKLEKEVHREDVRRYILRRWMETGRGRALVICQEKFEQWLKLPDDIEVKHFNDVSGLDVYRDIGLLVIVGRTAPGPRAMEAQAAALSGRQPRLVNGEGFVWYHPVKRGIRLLDSRGVETTGDQHPDDLVESVRWLVHEGELIQALGRGRGINRTEQTPLDVDLLFDTCLPIKVSNVSIWRRPSPLVETAVQGVMLTAQSDMVKVYPAIWPNNSAADRTMEQGVPELLGFVPLTYQLAGRKRRLAYFDLTIIREPMVWLRERLGTPLRLLSP
jgi:putative DNA primase/helicase